MSTQKRQYEQCARSREGDIVLVFDADHAPFRAFLQETVGFFLEDPSYFWCKRRTSFSTPTD